MLYFRQPVSKFLATTNSLLYKLLRSPNLATMTLHLCYLTSYFDCEALFPLLRELLGGFDDLLGNTIPISRSSQPTDLSLLHLPYLTCYYFYPRTQLSNLLDLVTNLKHLGMALVTMACSGFPAVLHSDGFGREHFPLAFALNTIAMHSSLTSCFTF